MPSKFDEACSHFDRAIRHTGELGVDQLSLIAEGLVKLSRAVEQQMDEVRRKLNSIFHDLP